METTQKTDNEVFAIFLGWEKGGEARPFFFSKKRAWYKHKDYHVKLWAEGFRYGKSWDHLMDVVQKIRQLAIAVEISFSLGVICKICYKHGQHFEWISVEDNDGLSTVKKACLEYITWYNQQVKP
jgi:hypothetical protein